MRHLTQTADARKGKLFWAFIAALALAQLVAFWMLCSEQVRKAAVRDAGLQVERAAMADCLRHIPDATRNSCARRIATRAHQQDAVRVAGETPGNSDGATSTMSSVVPVNFTFR